MTGVLITFNLASMAVLCWVFVNGFRVPEHVAVRQHIIFALLATALCVFAHSLTMMYAAAVGRMIREAVEKGSLKQAHVAQSTGYRKAIFKVASLAMILVMANTILAGGTHTRMFPVWVHDLLASAAILVNGWAVYLEIRSLIAGHMLGHQVASEFEKRT